jgi:hypothetical protein
MAARPPSLTSQFSSDELVFPIQLKGASQLLETKKQLCSLLMSTQVKKLRFKQIFSKPDNEIALGLKYDDHRGQLVYRKQEGHKDKFENIVKMNASEKSLMTILSEMWMQIDNFIDSAGGIDGKKLAAMSLLLSKPGGAPQWVHIDYQKKRGEDRVLLGVIALIGPASIDINMTALRWLQETGSYRFFQVERERCCVVNKEIQAEAINFMWADIPHSGVGFADLSYRLHLTFIQPSFTLPEDVTFIMCEPEVWIKDYCREMEESDLNLYRKHMTTEQALCLQKAKDFVAARK